MSERQSVILGVFLLTVFMLVMAIANPKLWSIELFKTLLTALVVTGILNMVVAFHFTASKQDDTKTANTGKAFDAIKAQAGASAAHDTATAAQANVVAAKTTEAVLDKAIDEDLFEPFKGPRL